MTGEGRRRRIFASNGKGDLCSVRQHVQDVATVLGLDYCRSPCGTDRNDLLQVLRPYKASRTDAGRVCAWPAE